jgi:hypothetical protein
MVQPADPYRRNNHDNLTDGADGANASNAANARRSNAAPPGAGPAPWDVVVPTGDHDQAAIAIAARNMLATPRSDGILYVGVNVSGEATEINALRANARVDVIQDAHTQGVYEWHGRRFDLDIAEGRRAFVATLGVDAEKGRAVDALLFRCRDEADKAKLAGIIDTLARGERGETIPSRIVISGHSAQGLSVYDQSGKNGKVFLGDVRAAARIFPNAARQIEDIHVAACSSANNVTLELPEWRRAFPNLVSVWAHDGEAPPAAGAELAEWERKTRGRASNVVPEAATMKNAHAAAWSSDGGLREGLGISDIRDNVQQVKVYFDDQWNLRPTKDARADAYWADKAYRAFRSLSQCADATAQERAFGKERADALFEILHPSTEGAR